MKKENLSEKFTSSLTYVLHFIENAQMQIDRLELEHKTDPRTIEAKRRSLLVIEKYVFDSKRYIDSLENRTNNEFKKISDLNNNKANWRSIYDIKIPGQREAARYESIARSKEKWQELY